MKAARIHNFGSPEVIVIDDVPLPTPAANQVLVRVVSGGVGPWDALIRQGKSVVNSPLPLTLGSDLSGIIEALGPAATEFKQGDEVYGVTNPEFIGAHAEFAVASSKMVAPKPASLSFTEAASVPVVAVTAWQMLFEYGKVQSGQTILILGAGGSVGGYAVQLASQAGLQVFATSSADDAQYLRSLGATTVIDYQRDRFEDVIPLVDVVLDMVGGDTRERSLKMLKPGGILVSVVSEPRPNPANPTKIRAVFFLANVTTDRLELISDLFDQGKLVPRVGTVLPLDQVRTAHEMLGGAPHKRGKIVLRVAAADSSPGLK
jgi:NADPH:quinone reductase-like Zn-dependent oxidoreductase